MTYPVSRRSFLAASAAASAALLLPARVGAASDTAKLTATTRTIEVGGRAARVMGLVNAQGGLGLTLDPGQRFRVDLTNALDTETIIHWHGQIPPNAQDGVPNTSPMLRPGETRRYDYAARPGTFWMHSHIPAQEVGLLAAPLIVRSEADLLADRQEVVLFLHDFSFNAPEAVLREITGGAGMDHAAMGHGGASGTGAVPGKTPMRMDLNDFEFDAYLANDRTLDDPEVVRVERGGRVLLRAVNASAMTALWIDLGAVRGRLVATDGEACVPYEATRFGLASAQRLDIEVDMPADGSALPVLCLREGARERTGIVLAPARAPVTRIASRSDTPHPAFSRNLVQESLFCGMTPLAQREVARRHDVVLSGSMMPYEWTIDGKVWGNHTPISARSGERVEITFHNMSMMAHPMHLHGHVFQVVGVGMRRIAGALRDTVHVPPMNSVTIAFDAGEAAPWMIHCHHMGHLETGMMTELQVQA
jgi:FtsP/CotA-like multicopper oxidase with cupredoxin domain